MPEHTETPSEARTTKERRELHDDAVRLDHADSKDEARRSREMKRRAKPSPSRRRKAARPH